MIFYLVGFVVALSSIFGIAHSQLARENLQLQKFYEWSYGILQEQLQIYDILGQQQHYAIDETFETLNNSEQPEGLEIEGCEEIEAAESRQQIEGIRERVKEASNIQSNEEENEEPVPDDQDEVLEAISKSIRKLSTAANSGRINGTQLYNILLQETLLHNNTVRAGDEPPGLILEELPEEQPQEQQQCSVSNALQNKRKMYFGEEPLEYLPHQKTDSDMDK